MNEPPVVLACEDVTLGYERRALLEHLTLTVRAGDYLCIVGENGSGKSTLLRALLGLPYDFIAENLLRSARKFSGRQLEEAVRLCAQTDFAMKNTGADDAELLKELLLRIAVGGAA